MKNLQAILVVFVSVFLFACNNGPLQTAKRTVIDGQITNMQAYPQSREFTLEVRDFSTKAPACYKATVDKSGKFKIYFDQFIAQDVSLTPYVRTFIAHPGDSIHIDIDYKNISEVKFTGDGEKTNNDINHYMNEYYADYDKKKLQSYFFKLDSSNYKAQCEVVKADLQKQRGEFMDKYQPNDEVKRWTENYININYYGARLRFKQFYNWAISSKKLKKLDKNTLATTVDNLNIDNTPKLINWPVPPEEVINQIYNPAVLNAESYSMLHILQPQKRDKETLEERYERSTKNKILKQMLIGDLFYIALINNDIQPVERQKKLFDWALTEPFVKAPLEKHYATVKSNLNNPKINSDAILRNVRGEARQLMDSIIKENKGKVIYIDVWATWCEPCKREFPYSRKLEDKFASKDVVFAFICIESPNDTWKYDISKFNLGGQHYYCDKDLSASLRYGLGITGIPYYIMIDKNGNITETDNVRPSNPLTEEKIKRLL